ncbi:MAG: type III pantothenate kinase [bacterium]
MKNATHLFMDIGNSCVKYAEGNLRQISSCKRTATASFTAAWLSRLKKSYPDAMLIVCSVVPKKSALLKKIWPKNRLHLLTHHSPLEFVLRYSKPHRIGADRLANAVAAAHLCPLPAIVIDFGTATTFDVVSKKKEFLGGVIAPGLDAMQHYLPARAAQLPRVALRQPKRAIGRDTTEAMQAGVLIGYRGLVREILRALCAELKTKRRVTLIATGGQAQFMARLLPEIFAIRPLLTLEGLQIIGKSLNP